MRQSRRATEEGPGARRAPPLPTELAVKACALGENGCGSGVSASPGHPASSRTVVTWPRVTLSADEVRPPVVPRARSVPRDYGSERPPQGDAGSAGPTGSPSPPATWEQEFLRDLPASPLSVPSSRLYTTATPAQAEATTRAGARRSDSPWGPSSGGLTAHTPTGPPRRRLAEGRQGPGDVLVRPHITKPSQL